MKFDSLAYLYIIFKALRPEEKDNSSQTQSSTSSSSDKDKPTTPPQRPKLNQSIVNMPDDDYD